MKFVSAFLALAAVMCIAAGQETEVTQGQIKFTFDEERPGLWVMELLKDGESTGRAFGARIFGLGELAPSTCDGVCDPWDKVEGRFLTREDNDDAITVDNIRISDDEGEGVRNINVTATFNFAAVQPDVTLHLTVIEADTSVTYSGLGGANREVTVESDALEWGFTVDEWTLADSANRFEFIYEVGSTIGGRNAKWVILCGEGNNAAEVSDSSFSLFGGSSLDPLDCRNNPDFGTIPITGLTEVSLAPRRARYAGQVDGQVNDDAAWRTVFEQTGTTENGEVEVEVLYDRTDEESDRTGNTKSFVRMRFPEGDNGPYHYDPVSFAAAGWLSASAFVTYAFALVAALAALM